MYLLNKIAPFISQPQKGDLIPICFNVRPTKNKFESIGKYNKGCLNGGVELPVKGKTWQIINSKRGRNWGHPELISFTKALSVEAQKIGWKGLYIGDLGNPRGGPTPYGHVSHQVGLEVDIKMKPPGQLQLSSEESNNDHRYGKPLFKELDVVTRDRKNVQHLVFANCVVLLVSAAMFRRNPITR